MIEHATISLHLFAHQDDELGILPVLRRELRANVRPVCVYLTSGAMPSRGTPAALARIRNAESVAVLRAAGCREEDVRFVGLAAGIEDGSLYQHLDRAFEALCRTLADVAAAPLQRIYCPAWEGGHHDHDAVHLLALALAARVGALDRVLQFPLYHGRNLPGALFMPHAPIPENGAPLRVPLPRCEAVANWLQARHYRSQWRTWAGLLLPALIKAALSPSLALQAASTARIRQRPHAGRLFYERRFGVSYDRFAALASPFADAHLPLHA